MHIDLSNRQSDVDLSDFCSQIEHIVSCVLEMEKKSGNFISIQFLSDSTMRRYHLKFFQDGTSTDCMSFPIDVEDLSPVQHLGEILVCPKTALRYVAKQKLPIDEVYKEIALYIIHGTLHLLGYDDISPQDRKIMRKKEAEAFLLLEKKGQIIWPSMQKETISESKDSHLKKRR